MRSRKGEETLPSEINTVIIAAIAVAIIIILAISILLNFNREEEVGKSYINSLKAEIEKADKGNVGIFEMINPKANEGKVALRSYVIYFSGVAGYKVPEYTFLAPSFDNNLLCICVFDEKPSCGLNQCVSLKFPAVLQGFSNGGAWYVDEGVKLKITFGGGKYVFEKVVEA